MIVRLLGAQGELCLVLCDRGILFRIVSRLALILGNSAGENVVPGLRHFLHHFTEGCRLALQEKVGNKLLLFVGLGTC